MGRTKAALAGRAWRHLRLALFWARKGGLIKRALLRDLRLVMHRHIKSLRGAARSDAIHAGEREFSLDETPIFHFRLSRSRPRSARMLHIPCINPPVDFDDDDNDFHFDRHRRASCQRWEDAYEAEEEEEEEGEEDGSAGDEADSEVSAADDQVRGDEETKDSGVDVKAEEFIAEFYAQMRLQRQISLLQYNEMLLRSTS